MQRIEVCATPEDSGKRIDKFLLENLLNLKAGISRTNIQDLINNKHIYNFDNKALSLNCSYKIKGNEKFIVEFPKPKKSEIIPQNIDFEIIFEDADMLVINKPAGLVTHPGSGVFDKTLVNGLLFKIGSSLSGINGVMRPGIVHRLDKDTSGLMVVAKNDLAHKNLAKQIETRELKRNYLALCYGTPNPSDGQINQNIDRCKNNRLKMRTVKRGGKTAITNYKTQKSYFDGLISLVECKLDTGRTHQIRVHMDAIGHPLIGDQLYKSKRHFLGSLNQELENLLNNFPRQFLHSHKIAFFHPKSNQKMQFTINLPQDLENLLKNISK